MLDLITSFPSIDFPRVDVSNPRAWIFKCNNYFRLIPNIPDHQKVSLASMHFDGKALYWFHSLGPRQWERCWGEFLEIISARFEDLKECKIIAEFNKLKQTGTYADYVEKFEELRDCMLLRSQSKFSEEYFVASFISGLSKDLQAFINIFEPSTLQKTIELGKWSLQKLDAIVDRTSTFRKLPRHAPELLKKC